MKKGYYVIAVLALAAVMTAGVGKAWAYFTSYAQAEGGYVINLSDKTEITEKFSDWTKHVAVTSDQDSAPVYIRVKAFGGNLYPLQYVPAVAGDWTKGENDDYYYYNKIVRGGETTSELQIEILKIPKKPEDGDTFNVIVIYESTPVLYDGEGNPYADWNALLDTGSSGQTEEAAAAPDEEGGGQP